MLETLHTLMSKVFIESTEDRSDVVSNKYIVKLDSILEKLYANSSSGKADIQVINDISVVIMDTAAEAYLLGLKDGTSIVSQLCGGVYNE